MTDQTSRPPVSTPPGLDPNRLSGLIADQHPFALVVTNPALPDNPIIYVNRAFELVTGYHASAVLGRNCRFLQGEDTDPATVATLRGALAREEPVTVNILNYRADGTPFWNNLRIEPVRDEAGELTCFLGVQKLLDDPAGDADRQLREIQHRVKNHLQMIVSMIRMQATAPGNAGEDYAALSRRVEALQILYTEMPGEAEDSEEVPLGAYLSRIATAISWLESSRGIRLHLDLAPLRVDVDFAGKIGLLASEVLTNAYQHAFGRGSEGLVAMALAQQEDGAIRLEISDDGAGLPAGSNWPGGQTMGGLMVQSFVQGLQAELDVTSAATGTRVVVTIPAP